MDSSVFQTSVESKALDISLLKKGIEFLQMIEKTSDCFLGKFV